MTTATNAAMIALIALDPNATWDPVTKQVMGSAYRQGESTHRADPAHDPRAALVAARISLLATKVLAFFFEQITGTGQVQVICCARRQRKCLRGAETSVVSSSPAPRLRRPRPGAASRTAIGELEALPIMRLQLLIAACATIAFATPAFAQIPPGCSELCAVSCIKPISIPDRWDDVTAIPDMRRAGPAKLANNFSYDQENFTDLNSNQLWDPGNPSPTAT